MARKLIFQLSFYFHWKKLGVVLNVAVGDLCSLPPPQLLLTALNVVKDL